MAVVLGCRILEELSKLNDENSGKALLNEIKVLADEVRERKRAEKEADLASLREAPEKDW